MADFNIKGLEQLVKAIKGKQPYAKIGILGSHVTRSGGGPSNAQIGAAHEFGTSQLPVRSFLRMPITENLQKKLDTSGAFTKDAMNRIIREGSFNAWVEKMAIVAESVVGEAFDTSGGGKWKTSNMSRKKVKQTLIETQSLRNSISSEVVSV